MKVNLERRSLVLGAAAAGVATAANAQVRTDTAPRVLTNQAPSKPLALCFPGGDRN